MRVRGLVALVLATLAGWGALALTKQTVREESDDQGSARAARRRISQSMAAATAAAWQAVPWEPLQPRSAGGLPYQTRVKALYSKNGLYVLMDAEDRTLTATMKEDFLDLWNEDVFEFFLWPDERYSVYFEYEISPLGYELPILIPNFEGRFLGWRPWHYDGKRKTQKATTVRGGPKQSGAHVTGWTAEVYVPYDLLKPLQNVPPERGDAVAGQLLPRGLRRRQARRLGLVPRRPQLPRVPKVRHAGL